MARTLRPLHDRVLVLPETAPETTASGLLYVADTSKEKPTQGRVIAIGPGKRLPDGTRLPMQVEVGQTVRYGRYDGRAVRIGGVDHMVLGEDEIDGVFEGEESKVEPVRWESHSDRLLKTLKPGSVFTEFILGGLFDGYEVRVQNESGVVLRATSFEGVDYDLVGKPQEVDPDSYVVLAFQRAAPSVPIPVNPYDAEREETIDRILHRFDDEEATDVEPIMQVSGYKAWGVQIEPADPTGFPPIIQSELPDSDYHDGVD